MTDTISNALKCVPGTNRRRFLLGAAAVPVAAVAKSSDSKGAIDMNMYTTIASNTSYLPNVGRWWRLHARMMRFQAAADAAEGARAQRLCDIHYRLFWQLLVMPAPDARAAIWKFDYLFLEDDEETPAWNLGMKDVRLAITDVRRCLGEEAWA